MEREKHLGILTHMAFGVQARQRCLVLLFQIWLGPAPAERRSTISMQCGIEIGPAGGSPMASDVFSDVVPELSTAEHISYGLALCLWAVASDVAAVLLLGTGMLHMIVWGAALLTVAFASKAALLRWARRGGRPLLTRKQAAPTWGAPARFLPLSSAWGFIWGFCASGATSRLPMSDDPDWTSRIVQGVTCAIVVPLFVLLVMKLKKRRH